MWEKKKGPDPNSGGDHHHWYHFFCSWMLQLRLGPLCLSVFTFRLAYDNAIKIPSCRLDHGDATQPPTCLHLRLPSPNVLT